MSQQFSNEINLSSPLNYLATKFIFFFLSVFHQFQQNYPIVLSKKKTKTQSSFGEPKIILKKKKLPVEGSNLDQSLVLNSWSAPSIRTQIRSSFPFALSTDFKIEPATPGTSRTGSRSGST